MWDVLLIIQNLKIIHQSVVLSLFFFFFFFFIFNPGVENSLVLKFSYLQIIWPLNLVELFIL